MLNRRTLLSWEFLVLALTNVAAWLAAMAESSVGYNSAVYWTAGSVGVYALVRGLAKVNHDHGDWWQQSEFLLALLGAGVTSLAALQDVINAHTYGILMAILTTLTALGNGIRKVPAVQVGADAPDPPTDYPADYGEDALDPDELDPPVDLEDDDAPAAGAV